MPAVIFIRKTTIDDMIVMNVRIIVAIDESGELGKVSQCFFNKT